MSVSLEEVVGLEAQKKKLYLSIINPLQKKELYHKLVKRPERVRTSKNFLFYGPPGTGKTFLANAVSQELNMECVSIAATQFLNEYVGKGASWLRNLYADDEEKLIFIDEVDIIGRKRENTRFKTGDDILTQLLFALDSNASSQHITTIMATNRYDILDEALLSRIPFDQRIEFSHPTFEQRCAILEYHSSNYNIKDIDTIEIARRCKGYDARQIKHLFDNAVNTALDEDRSYITNEDIIHHYQRREIYEV